MCKNRVTLSDSLIGNANRQDHVQGANEQNAGKDRDAVNRIMIEMKSLMNRVLMNNDQDGAPPMKM